MAADSRAAVPAEFMRRFVRRKQYIGQVELLGVLCAYTSFGERMRGKRVVHFVDNTSALAAAVRGYAGPVDSRRIVHALLATLHALRVSVWFDYVRSKANVSDAPSRVAQLSSHVMRVGRHIVSEPRVLLLPENRAWAAEAADWAFAAERTL